MSEDATAKAKPQRRPKSHHVHVIALDDRVGNSGKFRRCNPSAKSANVYRSSGVSGNSLPRADDASVRAKCVISTAELSSKACVSPSS